MTEDARTVAERQRNIAVEALRELKTVIKRNGMLGTNDWIEKRLEEIAAIAKPAQPPKSDLSEIGFRAHSRHK